jgi:uncharacterized protein YbcC (UPF0753/DUF2309 family)
MKIYIKQNVMRIISISFNIRRRELDDNYTLYENGEVLHEYDKSRYPGGYLLEKTLSADDISDEVKRKLFDATTDEDRELAKRLLKLQ